MSPSSALTCQELVEIITDYLEGKLPPAEVRRFEAHLSGCVGCTRYLAQMRKLIGLTGKLSEEAISEPAKSELLAVFQNWKETK